ncbi:ACP S-malonyltransferase [Pseudoxanthobacter sp. M-2]|uniref:ACP S-malonyltransferase n=1 Tax=Pseudoxanthobacter sp. M-2 TaxID=3078754 RepID=UPI0038FBEFF9
MTTAFTFPGQGSQSVGMGRALAESYAAARRVFEEVDEALGESLSTVIFEGPEDALTLTANAQPALMATSIAALRALEETGVDVKAMASFVAGHSLGEYSALVAAGSLSVTDAARLLRARGLAMQSAVAAGEGAMAALLGVDLEVAAAVAAEAAEDEVCDVANDNAPGQVVLSGSKAAVERAVALAKTRGAKRAVLLAVSAPFHCSLMAPAAEVMAEALASATVRAPVVPLYANVTASPVSDPAEIRRLLVEQVTGTVRWRESVAALAAGGVDCFVEIGAGTVLTGLAKRIARDARAFAVGTPADVEAFGERLAG